MSDAPVDESAGSSGGKNSKKSNPQVLTKNGIPSLTRELDASDVLECYALVRPALLHGFGDAAIKVQKMAIGVRYRPAPTAPRNKVPFELTLEYGPQRFGLGLLEESMPFVVQVDNPSANKDGEGDGGNRRENDDDMDKQDDTGNNELPSPYAHLSWENEGRVFYTRQIAPETYTNAYYMASMTGAVLDMLLREAVDFTSLRRRYQPFSVYVKNDNGDGSERRLASSSSSDFNYYIWQHLANLGVEVEPILEPPVYEARLHATGIKVVHAEPAVTHQAATFYQRLYQCIEAIATNDYDRYTSAPTATPEETPSPVATTLPPTYHHRNENVTDSAGESQEDGGAAEDEQIDDAGDDDRKRRTVPLQDDDPDQDTPALGTDEDEQSDSSTAVAQERPEDDDVDSNSPTNDAQQAANEAQAKADEASEAAKNEGDPTTANAAQAAADAAHKAAQATSNAVLIAAKEGLLGGDGAMMSSIISTCFSDPQYGISTKDENGTLLSPAFLYKDGSRYYQLNMTRPFVEVVKIHQPLPKQQDIGKGAIGSGDVVDWAIAWVFLFGVLLGIAMLLQQLGYRFFTGLLRCQRWYFHPRKVHREDDDDDYGENMPIFGEDAIPLSMGGKATLSPIRQSDFNSSFSGRSLQDLDLPGNLPNIPSSPVMRRSPLSYRKSNGGSGDDFGDLELQNMGSSGSLHSIKRKYSDGDSLTSLEDDKLLLTETSVPDRFMRDPDFVDLPHLKSQSKVAVPVGYRNRHSNGSISSDDDNF